MIAVSSRDVIRVYLESDKNLAEDQRTVFLTKPMTVGQLRRFKQSIQLKSGPQEFAFGLDEIIDVLNSVVTNWKNLRDSEGTIIAFSLQNPDRWDWATMEQLTEIFQACIQLNELSKEQIKN